MLSRSLSLRSLRHSAPQVIGKNSGRNAVGSARTSSSNTCRCFIDILNPKPLDHLGETMRFLSKTKTELDCQDFAVSQSIPLFKRHFFITSCDQFTRSFYANRLGVDLAPNVASPDQHAAQAVSHQPMESLVPKAPRKTTEQIRREIDYAGVKVSACRQARNILCQCCHSKIVRSFGIGLPSINRKATTKHSADSS